MFQSFARKATATASPVKISGVARVSVSSNANCEPAAPFQTRWKTEKGDAPAASTRNAVMTRVRMIAATG
jgi:hypothetical protein